MPQHGGPGSAGGKTYRNRLLPADVRSLARSYTRQAIKTLVLIMNDERVPAMSRVTAAKIMLDRGWGRATEHHHINVDGEGASLLKVVNEIVHVHETREQVEFRDQTPLLELSPEDTDGDGSKSTH